MGRRLNENITSDYISAANRLNGRTACRKIVAYVESYDDVYFWRTVLSPFETDHIRFEVMPPTRQRLARGKKPALMSLLAHRVGQDMIACVDADYDYLLQNTTPLSREICHNPYIFHTYAYAIENLQCYASSLHDVSVAVTLNDHTIFDFHEYLLQYSLAIHPLFVWSIWHYRRGLHGQFSITDFCRTIEPGSFSLRNAAATLQNVRRKATQKTRELQRLHPEARESWQQLDAELRQLGVTPTETYLYIQGHHLFDSVVVPAMKKVCERLVRERELEISRNAIHSVQRHNELSGYSHSTEGIIPMLRRNTGYASSAPFRHIQDDIRTFLSTHAHPSVQTTGNLS